MRLAYDALSLRCPWDSCIESSRKQWRGGGKAMVSWRGLGSLTGKRSSFKEAWTTWVTDTRKPKFPKRSGCSTRQERRQARRSSGALRELQVTAGNTAQSVRGALSKIGGRQEVAVSRGGRMAAGGRPRKALAALKAQLSGGPPGRCCPSQPHLGHCPSCWYPSRPRVGGFYQEVWPAS